MSDPKSCPISYSEALKARKVVYEYLKPTGLIAYKNLSSLLGAEILVKHENHHPTGSFKIRGGVNLLRHLKDISAEGVITFSTGNHGLSIAQSAAWVNMEATVVVPEQSNPAKKCSIQSTGAQLIEAGKTFEAASQVVDELVAEKGLYFAHPANEPHLINGVATEFIEILEDVPDLDAIILPLGAGSEVAAACVVLKKINPDIQIYAVQAANSSAAYQSWHKGEILTADNTTFAGGFATGSAYETPFAIYKDKLTDFVILSEEEIYQGIALAGYYTHQLVEGAGAATLMAALKLQEQLKGKKVVLQFSGCNASPGEILKAYQLPAFQEGWVG
ncbi:threonine/serine dehydratase [Marinospirillum sp.]|uniref:threonine ammonia-lyase n=1 Tax=Marinospirillum sp. TaxID=2183934 RepID=UPI00384E98C5